MIATIAAAMATAATPAGLAVRGLASWYGQAQALFDVDLQVGEREIVGVLGRNGAGKSTLLRSIARVHARAAGSILFNGVELIDREPHAVAAQGISLVREGGRVFASMTVEQNLRLGQQTARGRDRPAQTLGQIFEWFPVLEQFRRKQAGLLSGGQRQALALAIAFASSPRLLLLDEPSAGLAPSIAFQVFETIRSLSAGGLAIVVAEQNLSWLIGLATRAYELETGRIAAEAPPEEFVTATSRVRWR
jgi:ABC-type branched-subunit amino acid transport system ATPase component